MAQEEKRPSHEEPQVVMPYGYAPYCPPHEEDTIDLRELMATLRRRKKTVIWTTLLVLFATMIYLWKAHPIYEAKATLEIGKQLIKKSDGSIEIKYFDDAKSLKQALDVKYDTAGKYRDKNTTAYIKSVSVPRKTDQFLVIIADGRSNEMAKKVLHRPIDDILSKHRLYMESIIAVRRNQLQALENQLANYQNVKLKELKAQRDLILSTQVKKIEDQINLIKTVQIPLLQQKIDQAEKVIVQKAASVQELQKKLQKTTSKDPALAAIVAMQMSTLQNDITNLRLKILSLQEQIKRLQELTIPNLEKEKQRLLQNDLIQKEGQIKQLLEVTIPKLKTQITEANASIHEPYIVPTKIVGKIYTHDKPVKPKKKLIIIVALITGLMMGIFLAFFREFLSQNKEN